MDTQALAFEIDMATMALKGRRFREAEEKFKDLAMRANTVEAWCGLGISKFGLIMEDVTIDEVFYCFDKAKGIDKTKEAELETVVIETSIDVIKNLYDVILLTQQSIENAETERGKAAIATLAGTMMTIRNNKEGRVFGSIASAGLTALSYTGYVRAGATIGEMKILHDNVSAHIKNIETVLQQFVTKEVTLLEKFTKILNEKHVHVEVNIPLGKEVEKLKNSLTWYSIGFWFCLLLALSSIKMIFDTTDPDAGMVTIFFGGIAWICWYKRKKIKVELSEKEALLEKNRLKISKTN